MESLEDTFKQLENWRKDLSSDIVVQEEKGHWEYPRVQTWDPVAGEAADTEEVNKWVEANKEWVIDMPKIMKKDMARNKLKQIYNFSNFQETRKAAGTALGYFLLRIWAHEHPVAATMIGVGAASGLAYLIYQNLAK